MSVAGRLVGGGKADVRGGKADVRGGKNLFGGELNILAGKDSNLRRERRQFGRETSRQSPNTRMLIGLLGGNV